MASIYKELALRASPETVWDVVRDVGAVHTRFAPGFVTDTVLDGAERLVTFANGFVAREAIVTVDEERRRLAYSARSERIAHHNASFEVVRDGEGTRLIWIADVLPEDAAVTVEGMMTEGLKAVRRAIDGVPA
jgi:carbon monoxide dehydrogenase subunit G